MDTLFDLPVMDIIAGFIIVLIALFVWMTRIAWQQSRRVRQLEAELYNARMSNSAWADLSKGQLELIVQLKEQELAR